jgi:hypothetical protein
MFRYFRHLLVDALHIDFFSKNLISGLVSPAALFVTGTGKNDRT